ncbi:MAG: archaetidylinositol phosphate synthase [Candidatus Bathyarchaeia archaeon]|jgi:archaetidylinositol phosphate synthase
MLTRLKQKVQQALAAEARAAHRIGLTPNLITGTGMLLAFLSAFAYAEWQNPEWQSRTFFLLLAFVLLLLSGFCDALDGIVARLYGQATVFGGFLDSVLDRYADAAVYIGIIVGGLCTVLWVGLIAIVGSLLVSYSRARAEGAGIKMESVGLAERAERMIILLVATLIAFFWQPTTVMTVGIILLAILSNLTVLQRGLYVYGKSKKKETV